MTPLTVQAVHECSPLRASLGARGTEVGGTVEVAARRHIYQYIHQAGLSWETLRIGQVREMTAVI